MKGDKLKSVMEEDSKEIVLNLQASSSLGITGKYL